MDSGSAANGAGTRQERFESYGPNAIQAGRIDSVNVYNTASSSSQARASFPADYDAEWLEFAETCPKLAKTLEDQGASAWVKSLLEGLGDHAIEQLTRTGYLSGCLLLAGVRFANRITAADSRETLLAEAKAALQSRPRPIQEHSLLAWAASDPLEPLASATRKLRSELRRGAIEGSTRDEALGFIPFGALVMFFVDLYAALIDFNGEYATWIEHKTNARLELGRFSEHIIGPLRLAVSSDKRRITVEFSCDDADVHKAAALLVGRFELALESFENEFALAGIKIYYLRPIISACVGDNVANYNFEAYTPTLMPLLMGGHMYSTHLVFARELIQNSMDAIQSRIFSGRAPDNTDIDIDLVCEPPADCENRKTDGTAPGYPLKSRVVKFTISDNGMGMFRNDIERYLTNIGRSFYRSQEYQRLDYEYEPVSSYGIGFLSCFMVGGGIAIRTRKRDERDETLLLSIPNVEGCFFVERDKDERDEGTTITMELGDEDPVYLIDLLEYIGDTVRDIPFDVNVRWNEPPLEKYHLVDVGGNSLSYYNTDIPALARSQKRQPASEYAFVGDAILARAGDSSFQKNWWNKYLRQKLGNIDLFSDGSGYTQIAFERHSSRKMGDTFQMHVPLGEGAGADDYGIFISDVPAAGKRLMDRRNGKLPISGKLSVLNAGILVERAGLAPVFGQDMFMLVNETETAYNNVVVNFPPNLINLNISRDYVNGLARGVDVDGLIWGMSTRALDELDRKMSAEPACPLIHLHEAATFFELMSTKLNRNGATSETRELYARLTAKKLHLYVDPGDSGVAFQLGEGCESRDEMKRVIERVLEARSREGRPSGALDAFARRYVSCYDDASKKLSLDDMDRKLASSLETAGCIEVGSESAAVPDGFDGQRPPLSFILFCVYLMCLDNPRTTYKKASEIRLAIMKQVLRKHTVGEYMQGKLSVTVPWRTVDDYIDRFALRTDSTAR